MRYFIVLISALLVSGCANMHPQRPVFEGQGGAAVIFYPTDVDNLLSCLSESQSLKRRELQKLLKADSAKDEAGSDEQKLRSICLGLHEHATYTQFQASILLLQDYIQAHPDLHQGLHGVEILIKRIDQEKVDRWSLRNKLLDEKETLERENSLLQARIDRSQEVVEAYEKLQAAAEQDQIKIRELQKQIEQLKNIENIIKNREL